ncbi:MAG: PrsW family glutamic-type intramembrane protease [Bacteroidia bacterium]|nr:PrsW family glutamic-type intramembrane protease [Bacteroidia bacterium]MDW8346776.1 PrsW family glutamic-type intramembrane protease [Bacteroidia bacterium]
MSVIILIAALLPVVLINTFIYVRDKKDREPIKELVISFILGSLSIFFIFIQVILRELKLIGTWDNSQSTQDIFLHAFIEVALVEELAKYLVLRGYSYKRKAFNEPFDGIVYSVMVSMGFAGLENIFYSMQGIGTAILRAFTAVPAHATFAVAMGYYVGLAKFNPEKSVLYQFVGVVLAVIFHGFYDFFLMSNEQIGMAMGAFVTLIVGIVLSLKAIKRHRAIKEMDLH